MGLSVGEEEDLVKNLVALGREREEIAKEEEERG